MLACLLLSLVTSTRVPAQDNPPREPSERLRELEKKVEELTRRVESLQKQGADRDEKIQAELEEALEEARRAADGVAQAETSGTSKMLLAGDAFVQFTNRRGGGSSFTAALNPHFYWKLGERMLFGSGVELELGNDSTEPNLEWAEVFYEIGESATLGLGKFLMPFGYFQENIHAAYINKLPDEPFVVSNTFATTLAPTHDLGVQIRGPIPLGSARLNYVLYVANGPRLDLGTNDPATAGALEFENFDDNNRNKAVGGRIGFQPAPGVEIGYSALVARVGPDGTPFRNVDATLQDVDLNYVGRVGPLKGRVDARAEWVWSDVDPADFGSGVQNNRRRGGYAQLAYRPTELLGGPLADLEGVARYDRIEQPGGSPLPDVSSWTAGLDYYAGPTSVFKFAYQGGAGVERAFLFQYAVGF